MLKAKTSNVIEKQWQPCPKNKELENVCMLKCIKFGKTADLFVDLFVYFIKISAHENRMPGKLNFIHAYIWNEEKKKTAEESELRRYFDNGTQQNEAISMNILNCVAVCSYMYLLFSINIALENDEQIFIL